MENKDRNKKWALSMASGMIIQILVIGGLITTILTTNEMLRNIFIFVSIVVFIMSLVVIAVAMFIPAEHAKTTKVDIIAYSLWTPYRYGLKVLTFSYSIITIIAAAHAFYWFAVVGMMAAVCFAIWPHYMVKVDAESKQYMIEKLSGSS